MRSVFTKILLFSLVIGIPFSNAFAQTGGIVRIEQDDSSVTYTGDWYKNGSTANSAGSAALTNARGARATFSFNGTGVTWIGAVDPWSGLATVFLDGTSYTVDTYGDTTVYQKPLFSVQGLPFALHTLTIQVDHARDGNAQGSWIWVDAFEVEDGAGVNGGVNAPPGRTEQNSAATLYTGAWFAHNSNLHSAGSSALAIDPGSSVTVSFSGTGIAWIAYRDEWSGIAKLILDGHAPTLIDTYLTPAQSQAAAYSITGLPPGNHTLTIEVTGTHNPSSAGAWIWVDAFDIVP